MNKIRKNKGFTLVELLIVIVVLGILATIVTIGYNGSQAAVRDNKRKSDIQTIATAYLMHYQDTRRWYFNNAELKKVDPTTAATAEGFMTGRGFFNLQDGVPNSYTISMVNALTANNYLSTKLRDPQIASDDIKFVTQGQPPAQYMKYPCDTNGDGKDDSIFLSATLEKPTADDATNFTANLAKCYSVTSAKTLDKLDGGPKDFSNYAIIIP